MIWINDKHWRYFHRYAIKVIRPKNIHIHIFFRISKNQVVICENYLLFFPFRKTNRQSTLKTANKNSNILYLDIVQPSLSLQTFRLNCDCESVAKIFILRANIITLHSFQQILTIIFPMFFFGSSIAQNLFVIFFNKLLK